ncbi:microneme protein mic14 [Cystoisospora suis]|uniref:Microneme protein mic14 n=1 Tax=Cystoisospora suis TaxID=483139 RepID=A0A2C6KC13_9APIC|nr:microneme protein mic14 [Cystoisospora suis]
MVFDEIAGTHCTVGCRLNDVGLQTINKSVAGEWTEAKTETLVLSNPSYVFASVIGTDSFPLVALSRQTKSWFPGGPPANLPAGVAFLEKDSMRTGSAAAEQVAARSGDAMSQNGESTTASPKTRSSQQNTTGNGGTENSRTSSVFGNWYPVIDLIQDGDCAEGSLQRGTTFPSSPADVRLLYAKSVSATPPSQENRPVYRPDCQAARQKEGSSRDCVTECEELARACSAKGRDIWECFVESTPKEWKQKCTVMPTSATEALTTSTTAPPIDPAAACTIVDMQALEYQNMRGWDSKTDSCNCPHEIPACSPQQALFDSLTWSKLLGPEGSLCKSAGGTLKVVAHGFKLTQQNLCEKGFSTSQTSWEQIPFPPYAGEDLILGDNTIRGGYYRCTEEFRYVFCPGKLLYTTTTTAEPPWSWPADSDCVPTDWTEWSACSATCFSGSKGSKPAKTRKRFILVPKKGRGQDCVLLEQEPCERSSDFPACEEFCWQGNWSEWGACKLSTLKFGEDPLRTRTKIRYIFMDGGDVCPTESLIQHDTATCANTGSRTVPSVEATPSAPSEIDEPQPLPSPKPEHRETEEKGLAQPNEKSAAPGNGEGKENESSDRPDQGGTASGSLLQHSSETVESCDRLSAWSGCTAPCQPPAGDLGVKQYQLGLPRNVDTPISAYCATNTRDCSEKLQACKEDPTPDCSLVSGRYAAADETKQCRELCEIAVDACAKSAALIQQSQWECVAATLNDAGDGSCLYEREAVEDRVVRPPVCFLSRAQRADENTSLPFLHTDEATGAKSCKCATPATVPCSAEEVWRSSDTWGKLISSTVCPLNDLGAFFDKANLSGSADSSVFFAASGGVRVHCPVMTSPSGASLPTYTSFKNDAELDTFCEKGLSSWSGTTESIVDCSHAMLKDTAGTKDCRAACEKVLAKCDKSAPDLKACYKEALKDPEFAAECEVGLDRNLGGGLVFCKYARVNCEFSPWSDWNTCTHSCRNGEGDSNDSYRVRTRALRGSALNGGVCESDDKSGSSLVDIQLCDWLPLCSGEALPEPDYKIFPRKEPRLAEWTTERTTTTTVDPDAPPPGSEATVCTIIDMRDFKKAERGYDAKHKSCRCPSRTRLCARGEAMNSRENWQTHVETICARDSQADIYAQELEKFSCASREFVAVVGSFSANPEEDCKTDSMAYVFCKDEGPLQNDRTVLQFIVALVIGILLGLTFVYCALQYSVDIQQALGLAGRYVELSHMLQEVEEKENEAQAGSAGDDEKDGEGLPAGRGRGKLLGERGNGEPEEGGNSELTKEGGNSEVLEESGNSELPEDKREWRASTESGSVNE